MSLIFCLLDVFFRTNRVCLRSNICNKKQASERIFLNQFSSWRREPLINYYALFFLENLDFKLICPIFALLRSIVWQPSVKQIFLILVPLFKIDTAPFASKIFNLHSVAAVHQSTTVSIVNRTRKSEILALLWPLMSAFKTKKNITLFISIKTITLKALRELIYFYFTFCL
ncbi:hypothetical protein BAnh1_10430 [Bartonella australis AUST/NH1]|uniref:Uncharacterized protein n=1 Tax=Bartonella australis (strain Aust/NH1) TaxID=1094489 RepID=M1NZS0_BARAA|nr:hypothetical protein BAnh1_10430 [Bartonella australis AUST/NH1]